METDSRDEHLGMRSFFHPSMLRGRWCMLSTCIMVWACFSIQADQDGADEGQHVLTFEKDVRTIFKAMCFHCHGEDDIRKGGLDLRLVRLMQEGGESGSAVLASQPLKSLLWERIASDEMPDG